MNIIENRIIKFPGSILEYEALRGYKVIVIDTGTSNKGIFLDWRDCFACDMIDKGVEAIVNAIPYSVKKADCYGDTEALFYGLPVIKLKKGRDKKEK